MKVVLDTNVLIAAVAAPGLCRHLIREKILEHKTVTSDRLIQEFENKLKLKFDLRPEQFSFLIELRERSELVVPQKISPAVSRDPDDDWVLATAVGGHAQCIITGDKDLLVLQTFQAIQILSPRQFLEMLNTKP